eukprot:5653124-Prymnesium_polylepis.2
MAVSAGMFRRSTHWAADWSGGRFSDFHSGRDSISCATVPAWSMRSPSCTASVVLPVPGGPRFTTMRTAPDSSASTRAAWLAVCGCSRRASVSCGLDGAAAGGSYSARSSSRPDRCICCFHGAPKRIARLAFFSSSSASPRPTGALAGVVAAAEGAGRLRPPGDWNVGTPVAPNETKVPLPSEVTPNSEKRSIQVLIPPAWVTSSFAPSMRYTASPSVPHCARPPRRWSSLRT